MKNNIAQLSKWMSIGMISVMLLSLGFPGAPAHAIRNGTGTPPGDGGIIEPPDTEPPPPGETLDCFVDPQGSISITPETINLGQSATLTWNVIVPVGCGAMKVYINGLPVSPSGSRVVQPIANDGYELHARFGTAKHDFGTTAIKVSLTQNIFIRDKSELPLLLQALKFVENTNPDDGSIIDPAARRYIYVENQVEMDLSVFENIPIAAGVTLAGGRTPRHPGPRFYTTTSPRALFQVEGDNVRIAGVRIQGPYQEVWPENSDYCSGIRTDSFVNVVIENNEIFGWGGHAAVEIRDKGDRIDYVTNLDTVRVRDNYIHHNQQIGGNGYGVAVYNGAYALIERNVFDWNRHAISGGDGSDGSGYLAYRNLVLKNGGKHKEYPWPVGWAYTHQFDMHGQDGCYPTWALNCGTAGEYMDIRYNSFFYTKGEAFTLRGTPTIGADVNDNVFAHSSLFPTTGSVTPSALAQTESGLHASNNLVGVNGMNELGTCDFDGDGLNDLFLATGQTWWYSRGGTHMPWVYLNTSKKRRAEVTLGFFNADNTCDVWVDGVIYPGGRTQTLPGGGNHVPPGGGVANSAP